MTIEQLIDEYIGKNARMGYASNTTNKPRKVTPGRQGHWRPKRMQLRHLRMKKRPGKAPRRMPTGRRRRRAMLAQARHHEVMGKAQQLIDKYTD